MICHEHKIIFIHIPKTAGSSINKFYFGTKNKDWKIPNYDILYGWCPEFKIHLQHATPEQLLKTGLVSQKQWKEYFKFTFVRNPWDRAYSDYLWMKQDTQVQGSFKQFITRTGPFRKVLSDQSTKSYRGDHLLPQSVYFNGVKSSRFDFIGRFENFDQDILALNSRLGIKRSFNLFEKKNVNRLKHYSFFYNHSKMKMVEEIYAEDIERFDYKFIDKKIGFLKFKSWLHNG